MLSDPVTCGRNEPRSGQDFGSSAALWEIRVEAGTTGKAACVVRTCVVRRQGLEPRTR
jgi:hypothetical protein